MSISATLLQNDSGVRQMLSNRSHSLFPLSIKRMNREAFPTSVLFLKKPHLPFAGNVPLYPSAGNATTKQQGMLFQKQARQYSEMANFAPATSPFTFPHGV
jgi:hypothetical protein